MNVRVKTWSQFSSKFKDRKKPKQNMEAWQLDVPDERPTKAVKTQAGHHHYYRQI